MDRFVMEFSTDNAAFGDTADEEVARIAEILRFVADRIESTQKDGMLWDINGNTIGTYERRSSKK